MGTLSFYKKVFDFFLKRFQTTKGRQPMNPAEYYGIEREAVNWINKTKTYIYRYVYENVCIYTYIFIYIYMYI